MTTYIDLAIDIQKNTNSQQTPSLYLGSIQMVGAWDFQSIPSSSDPSNTAYFAQDDEGKKTKFLCGVIARMVVFSLRNS